MSKLQSVALVFLFVIFSLFICTTSATFAQDVTATITGTVTDSSGAAIVGATVTAQTTFMAMVGNFFETTC